MLALGMVMEFSGGSRMIASSVSQITAGGLDGPTQVIITLVVLYLITSILTELLSNAATIVIMAPISLEIASQIGLTAVDARAFLPDYMYSSFRQFYNPDWLSDEHICLFCWWI